MQTSKVTVVLFFVYNDWKIICEGFKNNMLVDYSRVVATHVHGLLFNTQVHQSVVAATTATQVHVPLNSTVVNTEVHG